MPNSQIPVKKKKYSGKSDPAVSIRYDRIIIRAILNFFMARSALGLSDGIIMNSPAFTLLSLPPCRLLRCNAAVGLARKLQLPTGFDAK